MTAKFSPTTAKDIQTVLNFFQNQQQQQQNTIAALAPLLQQSQQVANTGLNVLRAGGDPNVFFAQQPIPSTSNFSFQNPLYAGPSSDTTVLLNTLSNLLAPASSFTTYTSPFLSNLNNLLYTPANPANTVPLNPTPAPGSCSLGNPFFPTTITFIHTGTHPVAIYLLNYQCQDVPFALLAPGTVYTQLTFVGQTWHFYDAINGSPLLGQPEYVIPDDGPQTYLVYDVPGQQQRARVQATQSTRNEILRQRYDAIGQQQLDHYYNDNALSQLRIEYNQRSLAYLYADPLYLYWNFELDNINNQVRTTQPSYQALQNLTQEIKGWIAPPANQNQLRDRYAKRLQNQKLQSQLDNEVRAFISSHPQVAAQINSLTQSLDQRADQIQHSSDYLLWEADWNHRFQVAYYTSNQGIAETQQIKQLAQDYPDFAEYQQLRREVTDLLPSFDDRPQVKQVADLRTTVLADQGANQLVQTYNTRYLDQTTAVLTSTTIPVDLENYYELLNGLVETNPIYIQLRTNQLTAVQGLEAYRKQVHDAVAQCKARGSACDPTADPAVRALLNSGNTQALINGAGEFYELYNRFWYTFYTSADYLNLETSTKANLQGSLSIVQPSLQSAQAQFQQNVDSIPAVRNLRQASSDLVTSICANVSRARINGAPVTDPSAEMCARLDRMAVLAQSLNTVVQLQSTRFGSYLPLVGH